MSETPTIPTLSWGSSDELLLGTSSLQLLQTKGEECTIWKRKLPKPVKTAEFSPDASLIASIGFYDSLIKIWRRQSFGSEDTRFDFTYLPHPNTINGVRWRDGKNGEQAHGNVLYSICADKKVRIWAAINLHGLQALQQWAAIDMIESIQPRIKTALPLSDRYTFFVHSRDLDLAIQQVIERPQNLGEPDHALEHLTEIASRKPELCVVLDADGHMSAWGLEKIGCKVRATANVFNVAHIEDFRLPFTQNHDELEKRVQIFTFCDEGSDKTLDIFIHHFDGRLQWLGADVSALFDPSPRKDRVHSKALWTGHESTIKKIVRSATGRALVSRAHGNEGLIWKQLNAEKGVALVPASTLVCREHIERTCLLREGNFVVNLHPDRISMWSAQSSEAIMIASCDYMLVGKPLCLIILPESAHTSNCFHLATISSTMHGIVWKVTLPPTAPHDANLEWHNTTSITEFCHFANPLQDDLTFVLPVDPAGSPPHMPDFFDAFAKDVAVSYSDRGVLRTWTAELDTQKSNIRWLITSTVETSIIQPSLASTSSTRKSAIIDSARAGLTIWDMRSGQLEHEARYEAQDQIQDLDWSSTPDNQSILAVGFLHKVIILAQMRFDYLNVGPAWAPIREIHLKEYTPHPIGDSTWLGSGHLVIGAGNQLYVYDKEVIASDNMVTDLSILVHERKAMDLFGLVALLNGPLPVFHPQFLGQCILVGKASLVQKIILGLHKALKYFTTGDDLDSSVSIAAEAFYTEHEVRGPEDFSEATNFRRLLSTRLGKSCAPHTLTSRMLTKMNSSLRI